MRLDAAQRRAVLSHPAGWIASGFGAGFSPFASGTAGSAVALLPWLLLRGLSPWWWLVIIAAACAIGVWAATVVGRRLHIEDPGVIVWDEFVGQWITLWPLLLWPRHLAWVAVGFFLFRIFDVWKPWPVSWADRHVKGGFGVMLDDVLAGVYAALVLALLVRFF
ncbi:MAG: phosphatidylglycerophosphatase A [Dokdonella sp.]|nr:phosphatidylglycerophosphatase A [Dokdonella sp.]